MLGFKIGDMLLIFILFSYLSSAALSASTLQKLPLPSPGPVCLDFDVRGQGPYTGVADGRVLKHQGRKGFVDFAYTKPNRSRALCDGISSTDLAAVCGRPVGVAFNYATGQLYLTDPFLGLLVVGRRGGLATQLATSADGIAFRSPDSVDVDQKTGMVYFTDPSSVYGFNQLSEIISTNDSTGRLLRYDPKTKKVSALLSGLAGSGGVAVSKDSSFVVVAESNLNRIQKYWLKGAKANTAEVLVNLNGTPDKVRRTKSGDFWAGVTVQRNSTQDLTGVKFNKNGTILKQLTFSPEFNSTSISEVHEFRGSLFLGSLTGEYVGVYKNRSRSRSRP